MTKSIKTIDVQAKEWFDKINGNSYFAGTVTLNFGLKDMKQFNLPFQYGYEDHYKTQAIQLLKDNSILPEDLGQFNGRYYFEENNIIINYSKQENCLKRDLK